MRKTYSCKVLQIPDAHKSLVVDMRRRLLPDCQPVSSEMTLRREILRLPLDGGIIPGYAQAPKLPSYRFKALVKDEMTGKETEEMLLVVDLSPDLTLHNLKADKELAEGCDLPHQPLLLGEHRSFTSSRRRTHPHPVPVELWAGARK
ncbi:hypothetical protein Bbelb_432500 [Branchiostoma belcheri]|nr:hypothetical protein Bbelb_432500 [Branchiostoma belcheri]